MNTFWWIFYDFLFFLKKNFQWIFLFQFFRSLFFIQSKFSLRIFPFCDHFVRIFTGLSGNGRFQEPRQGHWRFGQAVEEDCGRRQSRAGKASTRVEEQISATTYDDHARSSAWSNDLRCQVRSRKSGRGTQRRDLFESQSMNFRVRCVNACLRRSISTWLTLIFEHPHSYASTCFWGKSNASQDLIAIWSEYCQFP